MRIGLLADTHDRVPAIAELTRRLSEGGVELILHAGDFCSPFALRPLMEISLPMAGVFGRNDGDREGLVAQTARGVGAEIYESPHSLEVGGERILLVHDIGEVHERSLEAHAIVVHGHSHRASREERGGSLLINPGEGCGWLHGTPMAAILDLATKELEVISLTEPHWKY